MSEQPTGRAPAGGGKKTLGLTRTQWIITGGVFVAVVGYILWKRHTASSAGSSTTTTTPAGGGCTDSQGNSVPCAEQGSGLSSGALTALQDELDSILGGGAGGGSAGGGGTLGTAGSTTTTTPAATTASTKTTTPAKTGGGGTKTAAKTAGAITGLKASASKTSFRASWNAAANATGYAYIVRDLATHEQVAGSTTTATSVTVSGLKSGTDYNFGIQALPGGAGDNIHVKTT